MAQFHFVEDYEKFVRDLMASYPIDEAMSLAVGGGYDAIGNIQLDILKFCGLRDGMTILDLGCGSGRLANATNELNIDYVGIDVVQELLDYAASKTPARYRFIKSQSLTIPLPDQSVDMVCAFSLFTHLLHTETYIYLEECKRVLKPDGRIVFSFLEFLLAMHWPIFKRTAEDQKLSTAPHLNQFIERSALVVWCRHLGLTLKDYVQGDANPWLTSPALGQSIAVLG